MLLLKAMVAVCEISSITVHRKAAYCIICTHTTFNRLSTWVSNIKISLQPLSFHKGSHTLHSHSRTGQSVQRPKPVGRKRRPTHHTRDPKQESIILWQVINKHQQKQKQHHNVSTISNFQSLEMWDILKPIINELQDEQGLKQRPQLSVSEIQKAYQIWDQHGKVQSHYPKKECRLLPN